MVTRKYLNITFYVHYLSCSGQLCCVPCDYWDKQQLFPCTKPPNDLSNGRTLRSLYIRADFYPVATPAVLLFNLETVKKCLCADSSSPLTRSVRPALWLSLQLSPVTWSECTDCHGNGKYRLECHSLSLQSDFGHKIWVSLGSSPTAILGIFKKV